MLISMIYWRIKLILYKNIWIWKVVILVLGFNKLIRIKINGIELISEIEIKGNKRLTSVDFGMFALLKCLRRLDFSYNSIVQIQCTRKLESQNLFDLDLRFNAIESIDLDTVVNINAESINLYQNPLRAIKSDKPWKASKRIEIFLLEPDKVSQFKHLCVEDKLTIR